MTGAALLELVAIGAQDSILTCGAEITFFKHGYQKYTNYSTEVISNTFNGTPDFGQSNVRCQINRNAVKNRSVRINPNKEIKEYYNKFYNMGDKVKIIITDEGNLIIE